jgi:sphingomyelin phosphodiesterase
MRKYNKTLPNKKLLLLIFILLNLFFTCRTSNINNNNSSSSTSTDKESLLCKSCKKIFSQINKGDHKYQIKFWKFIATRMCMIMEPYDNHVCEGAIGDLTPSVIESLITHWVDPDLICPFLNACPKVYHKINIDEKIREILKDKPKFKKLDKINNNPSFSSERRLLRILHVSDVHIDLQYAEGSNGLCGAPLCCRKDNLNPSKDFLRAGKWGTYAHCDIPVKTLQQFINFVNKEFKIDFAFWTGDNTSHDIWAQTYEKNIENSKVVTDMFRDKEKGFKFPIFPVIGNHESYPVNVYDFLSSRENKFNEFFNTLWHDWIGLINTNKNENNFSKFESFNKDLSYSYYLLELNLKIIGINSQACNPLNFYLMKDPTDPGAMLEWLRQELYKIESQGQRVYIISHIPPNKCLDSWAKIYSAIIDRFSHIIKGQFAGHTHGDSFQVFRDYFTKEINNLMFLPGSLTTYSNREPSFRIYEVDYETLEPVDYLQYRLDLDKWNQSESENIEWNLQYRFSEEYSLPNLSYLSFEILSHQLKNYDVYHTTAEKFADNEGEGRNRRYKTYQEYYCSTLPIPSEDNKCAGRKKDWLKKLFDLLRGDWKEKNN